LLGHEAMKRGRQPLSKTIRENAATMALYASAAPRDLDLDALALATIPEPRETIKRAKPNQRLEGDAQDEVIDYLKTCSHVSCIVRFNSATMQEQQRFIRMSTVYAKVWCEQFEDYIYPRVCDLQCVKRPGRIVVIEMKKPGWKRSKGRSELAKRECQQEAYMQMVREAGGLAGFCTSVEDLRKLLSGVGE
jgi:hypothetical protein